MSLNFNVIPYCILPQKMHMGMQLNLATGQHGGLTMSNETVVQADTPQMTRKQKVAAKKQAFVKDILTEMHRATCLDRGMEKAMTFIAKCIAKRPQEKTFYNTCLVEAMSLVNKELDGGKHAR